MPSQIATPTFGEETSFDIVAQRLAKADAGRLSKTLVSAVAHLHQLVREMRPTPAEWRGIVAFLTEVGHASDDKRQEWVLLSDLLGVSALVEEINARRPRGATPNTVRGPFYRADAPRLPNGANISLDAAGERLTVRGKVLDLDGKPVAGAVVETWQANDKGFYENQQPDLQPEFNLRGVFTTDAGGAFTYAAVKPAGYTVPDDGPVGRLLRLVGCPLRRPAHLHFVVNAEGFETITTHVFDRTDAELHEDPLFGVRPELLGDIRHETCKGGKIAWGLDFTFVMVRARPGRRTA
jgi:protocatechuate 3,4-dioxygenase beta subunit